MVPIVISGYFVCLKVMFWDARSFRTVGIVQLSKNSETKNRLYCYTDSAPESVPYRRTCSVTSLCYMDKEDLIMIDNDYGTKISVKEATTFFGAVLLS